MKIFLEILAKWMRCRINNKTINNIFHQFSKNEWGRAWETNHYFLALLWLLIAIHREKCPSFYIQTDAFLALLLTFFVSQSLLSDKLHAFNAGRKSLIRSAHIICPVCVFVRSFDTNKSFLVFNLKLLNLELVYMCVLYYSPWQIKLALDILGLFSNFLFNWDLIWQDYIVVTDKLFVHFSLV